MKSQLFIPAKIKVGFNLREDTYTGKLGYVIAHDGKVWRKEKSWEGWRVKFTTPEELNELKTKQFNDQVDNQKKNHQSYIENHKKNPQEAYYKKYAEMTEAQFLAQYNLDDFDTWIKSGRVYLGNLSDDESIKPVEFENVPTEGFVLNKKAGGYSTGWNHRSTYCRVYDPRGFEFEISIPNLLFILQETSAVKGKGLEGEFVYSWDGKDLVLLPAHCEEYKQSKQFTKLQDGKIGVKDLIPGCSYKKKNEQDLIYLGKFNWYALSYIRNNNSRELKIEKYHIFYDENYNKSYGSKFVVLKNLSSFASRNSDVPVSNYAELMEEFSKSQYATKPVSLEEESAIITERKNDSSHYVDGNYFLKISSDGEYAKYSIYTDYSSGGFYDENRNWIHKNIFKGYYLYKQETLTFKEGKLNISQVDYNKRSSERRYTQEEMDAMDFKKLFLKLESGSKIEIDKY